MLFDHGCDMVSLFLILMFSIALYRIEFDMNGFLSIIVIICLFLPAYFSMCETYFLRALHLPIINGANEGILFPMVASIFVYFTGKWNYILVIFKGSDFLLAKTSWYPYM